MLNLWLDYPTYKQEIAIVRSTTSSQVTRVRPAMSRQELLTFQSLVRQLPVADHVIEYAVSLVSKTRPGSDAAPDFVNNYVSYGAGPRASQFLILGAKALAALDGRLTPLISDVRAIAIPVLRHRIIPNFNAEADDVGRVDLIERLLAANT